MENRIYRYLSGELNRKEKIGLLRQVDTEDESRILFRRIKNIHAISSLADMPSDKEIAGESYRRFLLFRKKRKIFRISGQFLRYTAVALIFTGLTYWVMQSQGVTAEPDMLSFYVPAGQRMQMTLEDGSQVWLNARTTLKIPTRFSPEQRMVEIDGEALFTVSEDANRPFIVSSNGINVQVLGTRFNVNSYMQTGYYCTSLLEGSIQISNVNGMAEPIILEPDQQLRVADGEVYLEIIKNPGYFLWTEGIYSFNNEPLSNIFQKLSREFEVEIIVDSPSMNEWEYTGKFRQSDGIDGILRILNKYHQFVIKKDEENNIITLTERTIVNPSIPAMPMN